jgi:hypothetical protein
MGLSVTNMLGLSSSVPFTHIACYWTIRAFALHTSPLPRVIAGSNNSTVTLRVVGGDEKGSLKSETVKYGRCAGKGQQHIQKTDPSSRQRGRPTKQDRNCQRIINICPWAPMGLDTKTYWLTDRQSQCDFDFDKSSVSTGFAEQIIPILHILCYNVNLVSWTGVSLTTAKFKPVIFSTADLTLSYTANTFILMIPYDFCLFLAQFYYIF